MIFPPSVTDAARALVGMRIRTELAPGPTELTITEVEAYAGGDDPASHAYRGPSRRNATMFGPPGRLYVYRSYGIHWCMNVVTGPEGQGGAVLLRGGVPEIGADIMARRRGRSDHLADGPGKLAQALGVTGDFDGHDLSRPPVLLLDGERPAGTVLATPRIGISRAEDRLWRFVLAATA